MGSGWRAYYVQRVKDSSKREVSFVVDDCFSSPCENPMVI